MKIIYDKNQPRDRRLCLIGDDGLPYHGFQCFQIKLYDGKEGVKIGNWKKTLKERNAMFKYPTKEDANAGDDD